MTPVNRWGLAGQYPSYGGTSAPTVSFHLVWYAYMLLGAFFDTAGSLEFSGKEREDDYFPIIIRSETADAHTPCRAVFEPGAQTSLDV